MTTRSRAIATDPVRHPSRFVRIRPWLPVIVACGLLTAYSSQSGGHHIGPLSLTWRDKVDHFIVYGLLAIPVYRALPYRLSGTTRWICAFLFMSAFGICDETIQHFNPGRTGDPLDWFADSLGALIAVVIYSALPQVRTLANWNPFKTIIRW